MKDGIDMNNLLCKTVQEVAESSKGKEKGTDLEIVKFNAGAGSLEECRQPQ